MLKSFIGVSLALSSSAALAGVIYAPVSPEALASDVEMFIEPVETPADVLNNINIEEGSFKSGSSGIWSEITELDLGAMLNIGKQIWTVIEKNKPVVNIKYDYATALPAGVMTAGQLDGFSDIEHQSWRVHAKNGFGATVYDVTYTVVHQYGGSYEGKGQYLSTVTVLPSNVDVLWGYKVDLNVSNVATTNVGTGVDPVASLALEMTFRVSTVIKSHTSTTLYQFRGDSPVVKSTTLSRN